MFCSSGRWWVCVSVNLMFSWDHRFSSCVIIVCMWNDDRKILTFVNWKCPINSQFQFKLIYWHDRYFYICIADKNQYNDKKVICRHVPGQTCILFWFFIWFPLQKPLKLNSRACVWINFWCCWFFQHLLLWCVMFVKDTNSTEWMWISDSVQDLFIPLDLPVTRWPQKHSTVTSSPLNWLNVCKHVIIHLPASFSPSLRVFVLKDFVKGFRIIWHIQLIHFCQMRQNYKFKESESNWTQLHRLLWWASPNELFTDLISGRCSQSHVYNIKHAQCWVISSMSCV